MPDRDPNWGRFIADLRLRLCQAWCDLDRALQDSAGRTIPRAAGAWSALEIGEHVALVDHFLLLLTGKIADKALARRLRGDPVPRTPSCCAHLAKLAARDFRWMSPEHMLPTGRWTLVEVRERLAQDLERCLRLLDELPAGEGALHRIRMSVVGEDDRLDLYQFVCVIALHAERHAAQIRGGAG